MRNFLISGIISIAVIFSSSSFAQDLDISMLDGLSPAQIDIVKSELEKSKKVTKSQPEVTESTKKNKDIKDINSLNNKKYGYDFFSSIPTSIAAVGDLPLPNDYKISLNDQFTIILSGSRESIFDLNVNLDGTILFPELGSISVVGETFDDVKHKLRNLVKQSFIGVEIDLSLKNLSAKKVTIVGAVKAPGTYLINPFSTISSALGYSGGISEIGTLRNIKLRRIDGKTFNFDLYKLLIDGDRSNDITIESGDVIIINPAEQFVTLSGEVRRPAIYEMNKDETLENLIKFGLGFTQIANKSKINIRVLDIKSSSIQNLNVSNISSSLMDVVGVNINQYVNKSISSINVTGSIKEPGFYSISNNDTLEDLIERLEFVDVYPWLAVLEQFDDKNLVKSSILFSLNDLDTYKSVKLLPNSKLFFANVNLREFDVEPMTNALIEDYQLRINHRQGPFAIPVIGKYSVKSFVDLLGLNMMDVDDEATYISPLESIVIVDDYKKMQFNAQKYNTVSFRSPVNDLINIEIRGAIDYPGEYTLQSDSTLEDLYALIGNFKSEAFLNGIVFIRESTKERQRISIRKSQEALDKALLTSIQKGENIGNINIIRALSEEIEPENLGRIAGNFAPGSLTSINTILVEGDSIYIPRNPSTVNVLGEVLNPIAFEYSDRMNIRSAINNAGGYQDYADKRKTYVIKANGLIEKANRNIFTGRVNLEPGDTIVVPRKIITNNPGIELLLPVTKILSDLSFSAAALETLTNKN